ncbi:helix-turn-helix domain-containing protein [Fuchsiella alkaliacetigena]|uniref:helix-turn-helix domain-containing protein n=1 Tax=Fuchsiella alkaliacetigena TaxID=957042 RepID=UPI00200B0F3F|nr:helix-turn-helix transcriptional regulator [Fuchsiella alkaliacetigena]MCK8826030.1 helix-turn-helix transcriptional regulator [Fuchsiella alkaliacetigena]
MLGKRLKKLIKEHNLLQKDFAKKIGFSKSTVTMWIRGDREPDNKTLRKIADFFNVSVDYLLGRTNQKNPEKANSKIKQALADDPELFEFWQEISKREDLRLMFKQTKDLSPKSIHRIIEVIKIIEDQEKERYEG